MLQKPSFKEELRRYTAKGATNKQIVERWRHRTDAESIWETISAPCPDLAPADLVAAVIRFRARAQSAVNVIYGVSVPYTAREKLVDKGDGFAVPIAGEVVIPGIENEWASLKKRMNDVILNPGNFDPETAHNIVEAFAGLQLRYFAAIDDGPLPSRKDEGGTRVLRIFWQSIGDYLHTKCDRWFDGEVARLTEIAFGLPHVDPVSIANARKQRAH